MPETGFRDWLRSHRHLAKTNSLPNLIRRFGDEISISAAYRIAVAEGVRGRRRNKSLYDEFWAGLDWDLPDGVLSRIWGVMRGNIHQRRIRLGKGPPRFNARLDRDDETYRQQVTNEERRAATYDGDRPR